MTSLKNHMRLKCIGKKSECDICQKFFNNYCVMVVHKRIHFGERPYKCVDCGDRFNCSSSLKSHYKLRKQHLYDYGNFDFATTLSSYQTGEINPVYNSYKWNRYKQTYSGKFLKLCRRCQKKDNYFI